jgi:hypothetical protein
MVVPVTTGATGILTKCLRKYLEAKPGKPSFTIENSCTWNITQYGKCCSVNLVKPERSGTPLVQEK